MRVLLALLAPAILVALLVPPLRTNGACTAEFNALADRLEGARTQLLTVSAAEAFLTAQGLRYELVTPERCTQAKPRDVAICPPGVLLIGSVPVVDRVCHYYRDDRVRYQLTFNSAGQLLRIQTDMNPYRKFRFPGTALELDLAR